MLVPRTPSQVFVERPGSLRAGTGEQLGCGSTSLVCVNKEQLDQACTDPAAPQLRPDRNRGQQSYRRGISASRTHGRA